MEDEISFYTQVEKIQNYTKHGKKISLIQTHGKIRVKVLVHKEKVVKTLTKVFFFWQYKKVTSHKSIAPVAKKEIRL